jgi:hypothetical protein
MLLRQDELCPGDEEHHSEKTFDRKMRELFAAKVGTGKPSNDGSSGKRECE